MSEEITRMPAVALRGMTILPSMIVHFDVSRDKSIKAIEQAMTADQKLFVVTQRDPEASDPGIDDLYHIGTVVEIKQLVKLPKNIIRVLVEGLERAELLEMEASAGYLDAKVATFPDVKDQDYPGKGDEVGQQAMIRNCFRSTHRQTARSARSWCVRSWRSKIWTALCTGCIPAL